MEYDTLDGEYNLYAFHCEFCTYFLGERACEAFLSGIPMEVWNEVEPPKPSCNKENGIGFEEYVPLK